MRLTRALAGLPERYLRLADLSGLRLDASRREYVQEMSLVVGASGLVLASLAASLPIFALTNGVDAQGARLLHGMAGGLILGSIALTLAHLVRFLFWWPHSSRRVRRGEIDDGELPQRIPLLMSTDLDFALALVIVVVAAING
jgi:hypothetical protein